MCIRDRVCVGHQPPAGDKKGRGYMKAFLILEDGTVYAGTSIGTCLLYTSRCV